MSGPASAGLPLLLAVAEGRVSSAAAYSGPAWSPYLVGGLIGLLVCASMLWAGKPIGASSAYATLAGLIGMRLAPRRTADTCFYRKEPPRFNDSVVFIIATALGAFLAAWHGGELTGRMLPPFWEDQFGEGALGHRAAFALAGGALMAFGARLAGGCTSGHGISGAAQLSVASWIALLCFFAGGVVAAHLIYA